MRLYIERISGYDFSGYVETADLTDAEKATLKVTPDMEAVDVDGSFDIIEDVDGVLHVDGFEAYAWNEFEELEVTDLLCNFSDVENEIVASEKVIKRHFDIKSWEQYVCMDRE